MNALGRHILVEFVGCNSDILNDVSAIEKSMVSAAQEAGATVIQSTFHHFSPYGVSGVVVIQESHLAIHTWPEYQYAAVDLFTCGDTVDPWISFDSLKKALQSTNQSAIEMYRGSHSLVKRIDYHFEQRRQELTPSTQLPPKFARNIWFTDRDEDQALSLRYKGDPLFRAQSEYQKVAVYDTYSYGKMLAIDNMVMCTERDEFHYHEMLVHPVMQLHGQPKNVLVIGGGDGGTIREIAKYPSVEKMTMVEIDELVVRASLEHLPTLNGAFKDKRLDLKIEDGIKYVKNQKPQTFDVIVIDGSDPKGPAEGLFSEEFYQNCKKLLKPGGFLATQGESPMFHSQAFVELHRCLNRVFSDKHVHSLLYYATTYPSGMWSVNVAGMDAYDPVDHLSKDKVRAFAQSQKLRYYNENVHGASFQLPNFVREMLSSK